MIEFLTQNWPLLIGLAAAGLTAGLAAGLGGRIEVETNRQVVLQLIAEAKAAGSALIGIFHDRAAREAVADRYLDMSAAAAQPEYVYVV